jgi:hypothetical protein
MRSQVLAVAALVVAAGTAHGAVTFTSLAPDGRAASAEFSIGGQGRLTVVLTNTATTDVLVPTDVLTGILFNISGATVSLTPLTAELTRRSVVYYDADGQPVNDDVGGEWAYRDSMVGTPGERAYGISSTGRDFFGPFDRFGTINLAGPDEPDGLQYGILSDGDDVSTGNSGVLDSGGLIKNSVTFTFSGAGGLDLSRINNVLFLYGTSFSDEDVPALPAPGSLALIGVGILTAFRRRR